jgi:hypothetical protein
MGLCVRLLMRMWRGLAQKFEQAIISCWARLLAAGSGGIGQPTSDPPRAWQSQRGAADRTHAASPRSAPARRTPTRGAPGRAPRNPWRRPSLRHVHHAPPLPPPFLQSLVEELGGRLVAHLAAEGTQACDHLDEQLAGLAHTYRGTFFCRVPLRRGCAAGWGGGGGGAAAAAAAAALRGRLGLAELPALVAFRGGAVVGRAPVAQFGGGADVIEEEVGAAPAVSRGAGAERRRGCLAAPVSHSRDVLESCGGLGWRRRCSC